ncbi:hypothetical protein [Cohaesibacter gelatinilyticus]|uniref:Invasion protein IalB, involved in pathogenesis n=1 Tax=Cohaesibacter gelatinilyticus TaxID=372072 RepID=A0A285PDC2_9HYPH|nr:hypothetical protein [Cohaesibacter gelatinilyticus]SNZ19223.1 hypothetical protein SAMN06265368_2303 [Cohaesibacter gelatinilyticus]
MTHSLRKCGPLLTALLFLIATTGETFAQGWTTKTARNPAGGINALGWVSNGFSRITLYCGNDRSRIRITFEELPMPASMKRQDKRANFVLGMDLGNGKIRKVRIPTYYVASEDTWLGHVMFSYPQLESFGKAKRFLVYRPNGSIAKTFSAKGSLKFEEKLHEACYT